MLTFWETLTKMEQEGRPTHDGYNKWHAWEALQYTAICINFTNIRNVHCNGILRSAPSARLQRTSGIPRHGVRPQLVRENAFKTNVFGDM